MTARVVEQLAARGLRLMAVYENLRTAVDVMAVEIEAQHQLADQLGEDEGARVVRADAGRMTSAIATERDRAAHIVSAIFGEHAVSRPAASTPPTTRYSTGRPTPPARAGDRPWDGVATEATGPRWSRS